MRISVVVATDVPAAIETEIRRVAKIRELETEIAALIVAEMGRATSKSAVAVDRVEPTTAEIGRSTKNLEEALVVDALIAD